MGALCSSAVKDKEVDAAINAPDAVSSVGMPIEIYIDNNSIPVNDAEIYMRNLIASAWNNNQLLIDTGATKRQPIMVMINSNNGYLISSESFGQVHISARTLLEDVVQVFQILHDMTDIRRKIGCAGIRVKGLNFSGFNFSRLNLILTYVTKMINSVKIRPNSLANVIIEITPYELDQIEITGDSLTNMELIQIHSGASEKNILNHFQQFFG
jgi:hypothetical protein